MEDPQVRFEPRPWGDVDTPYIAIGGDARVREMADRFYDRIDASSPSLRAMLPKNDSTSRTKLYEFLSGWMGGPSLYIEKRGHPRLRMRHFPFAIGQAEVDEWIRCMDETMDEMGIEGQLRTFLDAQFTQSANHMRNR